MSRPIHLSGLVLRKGVASAMFSACRVFHVSSAACTFASAASRVNGGIGGRCMAVLSLVDWTSKTRAGFWNPATCVVF